MSESEKQRQNYSSKLTEANQLLSVAQQQLQTEINSSDLEKLYEEDPTEAARIEHRLRRKPVSYTHLTLPTKRIV